MGRPCSPGVPMDAPKTEKPLPGHLPDVQKMPWATFPISEQFPGQITSNSQRMTRTKMIVSMFQPWGRSANPARGWDGEVRTAKSALAIELPLQIAGNGLTTGLEMGFWQI